MPIARAPVSRPLNNKTPTSSHTFVLSICTSELLETTNNMPPKKTRTKRAASPAPEDNETKKRTQPKRGKKAEAEEPIADEESEPEPEPEPPKKKAKGKAKADANDEPKFLEAQIAKKGTSQVPLDEGCHLSGYHVFIDDDGLIWDASLNQTNASGNNNKFCMRIKVLRLEICSNCFGRPYSASREW
jgi:poly [ADP-ribose] polymerase